MTDTTSAAGAAFLVIGIAFLAIGASGHATFRTLNLVFLVSP